MGDFVFGAKVGYLLENFVPLSEVIVWGSLKWHTMFCQRN